MNKQSVALKDIKIGMYVELPISWLAHDFLKSKFLITSNEQLKKLQNLKLDKVTVNYDRSKVQPELFLSEAPIIETALADSATIQDPRHGSVPDNWDPKKLVTDELRNILQDDKLSPEQKSTFVYFHSIDMMKHLLEHPTADNIQVCKETIYHISEMVLSKNDMAMNLLRITSHDYSTYAHSVDVGIICIILSKLLLKKSDNHDLNELAAGFFLHDLGKVNIEQHILNKPGELTDAEMQIVQSHPQQGFQLLQQAQALSKECGIIVMQHHEAIDGSGYPDRLKGDDIHLYGKICAIVDVYTALTAERSYKHALSTFAALKLMKDSMAHRFDKKLFNSFVRIF